MVKTAVNWSWLGKGRVTYFKNNELGINRWGFSLKFAANTNNQATKMDFNLDSRGNLNPYNRSAIPFGEFEAIFVNAFESSETRRSIFDEFLRFQANLKASLNEGFTQWINGSFVSNKLDPNDIDFLTLLDFRTFNKH